MKNERATEILKDYRLWLLGHGPFYWSLNELIQALIVAESACITSQPKETKI